MPKKSVISQLQTAGESALGKVAQNSTTRSALRGAMQLKDRGERIVHGLESIDTRLEAIEKRLAALEAKAPKSRPRSGSKPPTTRAAKPRASTKA